MSDFSSRLQNVQDQPGYTGRPGMQTTTFWEHGTQPNVSHLASVDSISPLQLVVVGKIDPRTFRLSDIGDWTSSSAKAPSSAKWSLTLDKPSDPSLQDQFDRSIDTLDSIQQRAKDTYGIQTAYSVSGQRKIRLSAPMVQRRVPPMLSAVTDLEEHWNVREADKDAWDVLMLSHQLKPMIVLGQDHSPISPAQYTQTLPGSLAEVHFMLKLHTWRNTAIFSASIASLNIWKERSTAVSGYITGYIDSPSSDTPSAYDGVPLTLGPYRQQFVHRHEDVSYVSIYGWNDRLYRADDVDEDTEQTVITTSRNNSTVPDHTMALGPIVTYSSKPPVNPLSFFQGLPRPSSYEVIIAP